MTQSIADILAAVKPREAVARILLEPSLLERHRDLTAEMNAAPGLMLDAEQVVEIAKQIEQVEAEIEAKTAEFRFVGMGHKKWFDLMRDHAPTKDQGAVRFNPDTFPFAAIAESCVDPVLTAEEAEQFAKPLDASQFDELWGKCWLANQGGDDQNPKSPLAGGLLRQLSGQSETPATSSESPEASSSAE